MKYSGKEFFDKLQTALPGRSIRLTDFPSGAFMIDVPIGSETYIVEYLPDMGLGISRKSTATFGWEGVENEFSSFEEVEKYLSALFETETGKAEPGGSANSPPAHG